MNTPHDGANAERRAFRAKLKRLRKNCDFGSIHLIEELVAWVNTRDDRYNQKKGGL